MNFRTALLFSSAIIGRTLAYAQDIPDSLNLVENGSFELLDGKLKKLGGIGIAQGWKSPTGKNADLYSETITGPASAPKNDHGEQSALNGQNYAGLMWWSYLNKEPRTYIQSKLKHSLKKGSRYCVRFYTTLGDLSKYGSDQLGVYMSKMIVKKDEPMSLTYAAQIPTLKTKVYDDMFSWQGVCGVFDATGDEQYILIGNFAAQEKVNTAKVKRARGETRVQQTNAYYYIDEVSVFEIRQMSECKCEQLDKAESEFIFSKKTTVNHALKPTQQLDQSVLYFKRFNNQLDGAMDPLIAELITLMKDNPDIRIRLVGHTDAIEADRVRMRPDLTDLDKDRAAAVKAAFVEAGIDEARITTAGQKAESPADPGEGDVALAKNRRVEIEIEP